MFPEDITQGTVDIAGPLAKKLVDEKPEILEKILENQGSLGKFGSSPGESDFLQRSVDCGGGTEYSCCPRQCTPCPKGYREMRSNPKVHLAKFGSPPEPTGPICPEETGDFYCCKWQCTPCSCDDLGEPCV